MIAGRNPHVGVPFTRENAHGRLNLVITYRRWGTIQLELWGAFGLVAIQLPLLVESSDKNWRIWPLLSSFFIATVSGVKIELWRCVHMLLYVILRQLWYASGLLPSNGLFCRGKRQEDNNYVPNDRQVPFPSTYVWFYCPNVSNPYLQALDRDTDMCLTLNTCCTVRFVS